MRLASVSTRAERYKNELCYSIIFNSLSLYVYVCVFVRVFECRCVCVCVCLKLCCGYGSVRFGWELNLDLHILCS